MPKRQVDLVNGFAGMGNANLDPDSMANPMNIAASGTVDFDWDDDELPPEADEFIAKDANGNKLKIRVKKKMPDADGKVRNITAGVVYLTPAVCEKCGARAALNYTVLSASDKERAKEIIRKHKIKQHPEGSDLVFAENIPQQKPKRTPQQILAEDGNLR